MGKLFTLDVWFAPAAHFITSTLGIAAVSALIVLAALGWYWGGFKRRLGPLVKHLEGATDELKQIPTAEDFAASFHEFDRSINDNKLLGDAWRQFRTTLLFPDSDEPQVVSNVQPPGVYFRRDSLLGRNLNLRLYNAIPNLLTGAGILGTFIGLVAGIYLASGNLASDDIVQAKQAMQELLNGASLAFITSIVGLFSSILFSLGEKRWVHRFDEGLGRWIASLEQRLDSVTAERIARDHFQQSRQQTEVLEGFTEQLAFQVAEAFDEKLQSHVSTSVAPLLEQLVEGIQGLRGDRQTSNETVLQQLLEQFTERLDGAAGTEMQALSDTLANLNERLNEQTQQLAENHESSQQANQESMNNLAELFKQGAGDFQSQVSASVQEMTAEVRAALGEFTQQTQLQAETSQRAYLEQQRAAQQSTESLVTVIRDGSQALEGQAQASITSLSSSVEQLMQKLAAQQEQANAQADQRVALIGDAFEKPVEALTETVERFEAISTKTQDGVDRLESMLTGLQTATANIERLAAPIKDAAGGFERSGQQVADLAARIEQASSAVNQSIEAIRQSNQETMTAWSDYRQRFEGIDESLGRAFQGVTDGLQRYTEQVNGVTQDLDRHMAEIVGKLGGAVQELSEQVEELVEAVSKLERAAPGRGATGTYGRR